MIIWRQRKRTVIHKNERNYQAAVQYGRTKPENQRYHLIRDVKSKRGGKFHFVTELFEKLSKKGTLERVNENLEWKSKKLLLVPHLTISRNKERVDQFCPNDGPRFVNGKVNGMEI